MLRFRVDPLRPAPVMKVKSRYLLPALALCLSACVLIAANRPQSDAGQQVQFLAHFYKTYLSRPASADFDLPPGSFYSQRAETLIAMNRQLCTTLSRSDDICGYGADGDVFLNAQEIATDLNFKTSKFKAIPSGNNTIDVSFTVWPGNGVRYDRQLRYVLVKEPGGWRVDDVFFGTGGGFRETESMRHQISQENARVLAAARDVFDVVSWIFIYLRDKDMLARAERFVTFPVQICSTTGGCQAVHRDDGMLRQAIGHLHRAYYKGDFDTRTDLSSYFPRVDSAQTLEGKVVRLDALELSFRDRAWWISKIDLHALGKRIPVQSRLVKSTGGSG